MKILSFLSAFTCLFLLSCRENADITAPVKYEGGILVNFNNYEPAEGNTSYLKYEVPLKDTVINVAVELKLTNTTEPAPEDIYVYLIKSDALVSGYNTANGTTLSTVSNTDAAFQYDFSKPVVIKKGTRRAMINMTINPKKLDLTKQNAIGIGILRVEGAGAAVNNTTAAKLVIEFGARNKYDGRYLLKGFHNRPTLEDPYEEEVHMISTGENSVTMFWPALGAYAHPIHGGTTYYTNFTTQFTFNPTNNNLVGVDNPLNPGVPVFTIGPATNSRYVPGPPARIYAQYYYSANLQRMFTDTLTYLGPR